MSPPRTVTVLLVDDDDDDITLTREALQEERVLVDLHVARDGIECLDFLKRRAPYGDAPRPDVVLLDINMPRMDGLEALRAMKADPALASIPVVVLTTSEQDKDILVAYRHQAAAYVVKPVDFHAFQEVVKRIELFWFNVVTFADEEENKRMRTAKVERV